MSDLDTSLDIVIRSVVDEDSAKKAPREISKIILGALKDGYIEIPATISKEFDKKKASANLIKAQQDFVNQWKKMSKVGFSSSTKDLDMLTTKYLKLKRLMGLEGKNNSKQGRALRDANIGKILTAYTNSTDTVKQKLKEITASQANVNKEITKIEKQQKRSVKSARRVMNNTKKTTTRSKEKDDAFFKDISEGGNGSSKTRLGTRGSTWDDTYIGHNDQKEKPNRLLTLNDRYGTYHSRNSLLKQFAQNRRKFRKKAKESLITRNIQGALEAATVRDLFARADEKYKFDTKNKASKDDSYYKIAKYAGGIMGPKPDVTTDQLTDEIVTAITKELSQTDLVSITPALEKALDKETTMLMNRFKDGGVIGVNYGDDGTVKGVGVNYERWKAAITDVMHSFGRLDFTEIQEAFDKVRDSFANILRSVVDEQKSLTAEMDKNKKQISKNKEVLVTELRTREMLVKQLDKYKQQRKEDRSSLKTLNEQKSELDTRKDAFLSKYNEVKAEYKGKYDAIRKELYQVEQEEKKFLHKGDSTQRSPEEKALSARRMELIHKSSQNPYGKMIPEYDKIMDESRDLNRKIESLEKNIDSNNAHIKEYTTAIKELDGLSKEEQDARNQQIAQLRKENENLEKENTQLAKRKATLSRKYTNVSKKMSDERNYSSVGDVVRQAFKPLLNGAFNDSDGIEDKLGDLNESNTRQERLAARNINQAGVANSAAGRSAKALESATFAIEDIERVDAEDGFNDASMAEQLLAATQALKDTVKLILKDGIPVKPGKKKDQLPEEPTALSTNVIDPVTGNMYKSHVRDDSKYIARPENSVVLPTQDQYRKALEKSQEKSINDPEVVKVINEEYDKLNRGEHESQQRTFLDPSEVNSFQRGFIGIIQKAMKPLLPKSKADEIMSASQSKIARMRAERMEIYGEGRRGGLRDTGDLIGLARVRDIWNQLRGRSNAADGGILKNIKLEKGFNGENAIDTTKILENMNKVLTGPEMFKAQTGGVLRNLIGSMTMYLGMPSLEKSKAQADGLNQIMAYVRNEVLGLIQDIKADETTLQGMMDIGTARFDKNGIITEDSSSMAKKTAADLDDRKLKLKEVLVEVGTIDDIVRRCGGNISKIVKELGFVMPELMDQNIVLQNLNAGLDKSGKALKFQTRTGEVLNYTFQLMARSIGQMWKNWLAQLNPITQIKKAFKDFAGYDVKWKRTMNVIKYNFQSVIRPAMQWLAQQAVNLIGVFDKFLMKVQTAFGKTPVSLFDQSAADAEKMRRELEEAANVTAGFDELHDIGSNNSGENDLLGDIYKPQDIGIFKELGAAAEALANKVVPIFTTLGNIFKWCLNHWKALVTAFAIFEVAKGLWNLLMFAKGLKDVFGGLAGLPWGTIAKGISLVAGALSLAYAGYESYTLATDWDQLTDKEKNSKLTQSTGFGALGGGLVGGFIGSFFGPGGTAIGATIGASIGTAIFGGINASISAYNGDDTRREIMGTIGGAGLGASIGAIIGTAICPGIGTAVGAGLGAVVGGISSFLGEKLTTTIFSNGGPFSNLKISQKDLAWASEEVTKAQNAQTESLYKLKQMEETTGQSGQRLFELVDSGKLSYDRMTSSQIALVEQYKNYQDATDKVNEAMKRHTDWALAIEKDNAHITGSFETLVEGMIKAKDDGIYTEEELRDRLAQVYGEIENNQREVFLNTLPETMRESVEAQGQQYVSKWDKFKLSISEKWDEFKTSWSTFCTELETSAKTGWENIKNSIVDNAKKAWEGAKGFFSKIGDGVKSAWESLKGFARDTGERMYNLITGNGFKTNSQLNVASLAVGTNYVPNDGLAYLHQGEAVIPKKYNQPYQQEGLSPEEREYMSQMISTMKTLDTTMKQGINVKGQFVQRGSDLVATVQKNNNRLSNNVLNNKVYAR